MKKKTFKDGPNLRENRNGLLLSINDKNDFKFINDYDHYFIYVDILIKNQLTHYLNNNNIYNYTIIDYISNEKIINNNELEELFQVYIDIYCDKLNVIHI